MSKPDRVQKEGRQGRPGAGPALPALMQGWSLEAILPGRPEIAALAEIVPPATRVYLSALPRVDHARQIAAARLVRAAGLEPVPHVAARSFADEAQLADYLAAARGEADVRCCLVVGGDITVPRGPFTSALSLLRSAAFGRAGLREVGLAGYPDVHPLLGRAELDRILRDKLGTARDAGLAVHLVTQFCFSPHAIRDWYLSLRAREPDLPVRLGIAGPASANTLLRFALRCSVNLPVRHANTALQLLRGVAADAMLTALADELAGEAGSGRVSVHLFSFGGLTRTAAWARALASGAATGNGPPSRPSLLHRLRQIGGFRPS